MNFKSKTEAYLYALYLLEKLLLKYPANVVYVQAEIESIRQCVENHEQDPQRVADILRQLPDNITFDAKDKSVLIQVANAISQGTYQQTPQEKWENPLGRRFESQLQIQMLQSPTPVMMASIKKVSEKMIEILDKDPGLQLHFMEFLNQKSHVIAFGSFQVTPSYDSVRSLLSQNDPRKLADIMHAHFKFAQNFSRVLGGEHASQANANRRITDNHMCRSDYYIERGRAGEFGKKRTGQMGLLATEGGLFNHDLPMHESQWVPDAKAQPANLNSPFVRSLNDNDTPYVAGPSGMTSVFIGHMLGFEALPTEVERQCYTASVAAYMVSGGFHSLHEVLGPVAHCLPRENLVPGYRVSGVDKIQAGTGEPPNFSAFYQNMANIDPDFSSVRQAGWQKLNAFVGEKYIPQNPVLPTYEAMTRDYGSVVRDGIDNYQKREKSILYYLNPDKERGIIRSNNYKKMVADVETDFEKMVITYALLAAKDGDALKMHVAKKLGFSHPEDARKEVLKCIKSEVQRNLDERFPLTEQNRDYHSPLQKTRFENTFHELDKEIVAKIVLCANTKKSYTNSEDRGDFTQPLELLKQMRERLYLAEPPPALIMSLPGA